MDNNNIYLDFIRQLSENGSAVDKNEQNKDTEQQTEQQTNTNNQADAPAVTEVREDMDKAFDNTNAFEQYVQELQNRTKYNDASNEKLLGVVSDVAKGNKPYYHLSMQGQQDALEAQKELTKRLASGDISYDVQPKKEVTKNKSGYYIYDPENEQNEFLNLSDAQLSTKMKDVNTKLKSMSGKEDDYADTFKIAEKLNEAITYRNKSHEANDPALRAAIEKENKQRQAQQKAQQQKAIESTDSYKLNLWIKQHLSENDENDTIYNSTGYNLGAQATYGKSQQEAIQIAYAYTQDKSHSLEDQKNFVRGALNGYKQDDNQLIPRYLGENMLRANIKNAKTEEEKSDSTKVYDEYVKIVKAESPGKKNSYVNKMENEALAKFIASYQKASADNAKLAEENYNKSFGFLRDGEDIEMANLKRASQYLTGVDIAGLIRQAWDSMDPNTMRASAVRLAESRGEMTEQGIQKAQNEIVDTFYKDCIKYVKDDIPEGAFGVIQNAFANSIAGNLWQGTIRQASGNNNELTLLDVYQQRLQESDRNYNKNGWSGAAKLITSKAFQMGFDTPLFGGIGRVASTATKPLLKPFVSLAVGKWVPKAVYNSAFNAFASTGGGRLVVGVTSGAMTGALFNPISMLSQSYATGQSASFGEYLSGSATGALHFGAMGFTPIIGNYITKHINKVFSGTGKAQTIVRTMSNVVVQDVISPGINAAIVTGLENWREIVKHGISPDLVTEYARTYGEFIGMHLGGKVSHLGKGKLISNLKSMYGYKTALQQQGFTKSELDAINNSEAVAKIKRIINESATIGDAEMKQISELHKEIIADNTIPEGAKLKLFAIVGDSAIATPTITNVERFEEGGKHVVKVYTAEGKLFSANEFSSKTQAENEVSRISNITEKNKILATQSTFDAVWFQQVTNDATRALAEAKGVDVTEMPKQLGDIAERYKSGAEISSEDKALLKEFDDAIKTAVNNTTLQNSEQLKNSYKIAGVSIDKILAKDYSQWSKSDKELVSRYVDTMNSAIAKDNERKDAMIRRREVASIIKQSFDEGNSLEDAQSINDTALRVNALENSLGDYLTDELRSEIMNDPVSAYERVYNDENLSAPVKERILEYITTRAKFDGFVSSVNERIDTEIEASNTAIDAITHKSEGNVIEVDVTDNSGIEKGKKVYVVNGKLSTNGNSFVDLENSDKTIAIIVEGDEKPRMISPSKIVRVVNNNSADELKNSAREEIVARISAESNNAVNGTINSVSVGDKISIANDEGNVVEAEVVQPTDKEGNLIAPKEGEVFIKVGEDIFSISLEQLSIRAGNAKYDAISNEYRIEAEPTSEDGIRVDLAKDEAEENVAPELDKTTDEENIPQQAYKPGQFTLREGGEDKLAIVTGNVDEQGRIQYLVQGENEFRYATNEQMRELAKDYKPYEEAEAEGNAIPEAEAKEVANVEQREAENEAEAVEQKVADEFPVDENGKKDYVSAGAERTAKHIYEELELEKENADELVDNNIASATEELAKAEKDKEEALKGVTDPDEMAALQKSANEAVAKAKQKKELWEDVKAERAKQNEENDETKQLPNTSDNLQGVDIERLRYLDELYQKKDEEYERNKGDKDYLTPLHDDKEMLELFGISGEIEDIIGKLNEDQLKSIKSIFDEDSRVYFCASENLGDIVTSRINDLTDAELKEYIKRKEDYYEYAEDLLEEREWERSKESEPEYESEFVNPESLYNEILEGQGDISVKAKKNYSLNKYIDKKGRPQLRGVYHKDGYAIATDTHVLVADKRKYDKENDGKIIDKDGNEIELGYPNAFAVVPRRIISSDIDAMDLLNFIAGVKEIVKSKKENIKDKVILLNVGGELWAGSVENLDKFVNAAVSLGGKIYFNENVGTGIYTRPIYTESDKGFAVMMPVDYKRGGGIDKDRYFAYKPAELGSETESIVGKEKHQLGEGGELRMAQELTEKSRNDMQTVARSLGVELVFDENLKENGRYTTIDKATGRPTIHVAMNASNPLESVFGHEATHRVKSLDNASYGELHDVARLMIGDEEFFDRANQKKELYAKNGITLSDADAREEVVSDYIGSLIYDKEHMGKVADKLSKPILSKIRDVVSDFLDYFRRNKMTADERLAKGSLRAIDRAFARASGVHSMMGASALESEGDKKYNLRTEDELAELIRTETTKNRENKKYEGIVFSEQEVESIINETQELFKAIDSALEGNDFWDEWKHKGPTIMFDWRDGQMHPIVTWARNNVEYKYDVSADLLCVNNESIEAILASPDMVKLMGIINDNQAGKGDKYQKGFNSDDYMRLYETLRDMGINVPCKGCFDAAARLKMLASVSQKFVDLVNETIDRRNKNPEKFDAELRKKAEGESASKITEVGFLGSGESKKAAIEIGVAGDNLTEHITWEQLMSAEGQTKALKEWGGVFRAWQKTGAGRPKDKLLPEPYTGVMTNQTKTIIAPFGKSTPSFREQEVNTGTGLRRNSHSEYRPMLIVDEIQFMRDCYLKNLLVFKYMKDLDDARLFGKFGVKMNMSFFPAWEKGAPVCGLDKNGNYLPSEESVGSREFVYTDKDGKQHFDGQKGFEEALKLCNEDVSLSSVVMSIPHLLKCMTDVPTHKDPKGIWGSLIPFHASGATAAQLFKQGLGMARAMKHFEEALTDYDKGVTNFEAVQNDRFGKGWKILEGKKKGTNVQEGHKLEFVNGTHYYNKELGLHLFSSWFVKDSELTQEQKDGLFLKTKMTDEERKKFKENLKKTVGTPFSIDYNNTVREIGGKHPYKNAADKLSDELRKMNLIPRFEFEVPEYIFLKMCADAKVDPKHPKLGWKGKGHGWSPTDSDAYYSLWCDYGMTDPKTGKYSPHRPVGFINEKGEREFRLPDNVVEIAKNSVDRYTKLRQKENDMYEDIMREYVTRSVTEKKLTQKQADEFLSNLEGPGSKYSLRDDAEQINSDNRQSDKFSIRANDELEKKSLVGIHNLTDDNLRYAIKLGGLANPSTAVVDTDIMGLEEFGDISLIMPKSLVEKSTGKNAGTFAGDGYTPRFPSMDIIRQISDKGRGLIEKDFSGDDRFSKDIRSALLNYGNEFGGITPTLYYLYKSENGGADVVRFNAEKPKSAEEKQMVDKYADKNYYELTDAEKQELLNYTKASVRERMIRIQNLFGKKNGLSADEIAKRVDDRLEGKDWDKEAQIVLRGLSHIAEMQRKDGEIDYEGTYSKAERDVLTSSDSLKFRTWLDGKAKKYGIKERIFTGFDTKGNRKYEPFTINNISKIMTKQGGAGSEVYQSHSPFALRAKLLDKYSTLEGIKAGTSKLTKSDDYFESRQNIEDTYYALIEEIATKISSKSTEEAGAVLSDSLLEGFDYVRKKYKARFSTEMKDRIKDFGSLLKESPAIYFETKFERPVMLKEFVAAVVPKDIDAELKNSLIGNGIAIEEYERGNEESRLEAVKRASNREDVKFSIRDDDSMVDGDEESKPVTLRSILSDRNIGLKEQITLSKALFAEQNQSDKTLLNEFIRSVTDNLSDVRKAMSAQKVYDQATVKRVADLAKIMLSTGHLSNLGNGEQQRLLSAIKNSTGANNNDKRVQKIMDIMVSNQLKNGELALEALEKKKGTRLDSTRVQHVGELDPAGNIMLEAFKNCRKMSDEKLSEQIGEYLDKMDSSDEAIADNASNAYAGAMIAKLYHEKIRTSIEDEQTLQDSLDDVSSNKELKKNNPEAYRQLVDSINDAIRQNRIDRAQAYYDLVGMLTNKMKDSAENAKQFKEAEKQRVNNIHHIANSDMQGRKLRGDRKDNTLEGINNFPVFRFLASPLANLDQMLRMLGGKNSYGRGYLWNHFMRGWADSADKEQVATEKYYDMLDKKAADIFGEKGYVFNGNPIKRAYRYTDLYSYAEDLPKATISYLDGGEMREYALTQAELLYLYAVEKMPLGRATNRKMGISEDVMEQITNVLDEKLKRFADWTQEELLPSLGNEMNAVHRRMFGANMDSIENYFPFVRDKKAIKVEVENGNLKNFNDKISVKTGAIKKRTANVIKWDMPNCNFFKVLAKHVDEGCHWMGFAEINKDFSTLLSYNRFKQQVMNINSVYGNGSTLWKTFANVCAIATDAYEPQRSESDELMVRIAKNVTLSKIAFNPMPAIKQLLSLPAFFGEVKPQYVMQSLLRGGVADVKWAWENLPNYRKRVKSRMIGDYYLRDSEFEKKGGIVGLLQTAGDKLEGFAKRGMIPNIGIDAWTIAVGAYGAYRTAKDKYIRWGMSEEKAEERAKQDATLCYNKSQQSSEGPFMSKVQIDHTFFSTMMMLFRNAATSYTRETHASLRNLKRLVSGEVDYEYMAKQILRQAEIPTFSKLFDSELNRQAEGTLANDHDYSLGTPGGKLQSAGIEDKPIKLFPELLSAVAEQNGLEVKYFSGLVDAINNPVAVFNEDGQTRIVVETDGGNDHCIIDIQPNEEGYRVTNIEPLSNHPDRYKMIAESLLDLNAPKYINQGKAKRMLKMSGVLSEFNKEDKKAIRNIANNFVNPIVPEQQNLSVWRKEDIDKAKKQAKREIVGSTAKNIVNTAIFGLVLPWAWRIGGAASLLLLSDDDDAKQEVIDDANRKAVTSGIEGIAYGDVVTDGLHVLWDRFVNGNKDAKLSYLGRNNPFYSDMSTMLRHMDRDVMQGCADIINIFISSMTGVNPQLVSNWTAAWMDKASGNRELSNEWGLFAARIVNTPKSQLENIYFEEVGLMGSEVSNYTPEQLAMRFANYQVRRGYSIIPSSCVGDSAFTKQKNYAFKIIKEKMNNSIDKDTQQKYEQFSASINEGKKKVGEAKNKFIDGVIDGAQLYASLRYSKDYDIYRKYAKYDAELTKVVNLYLNCESTKEAKFLINSIRDIRRNLVESYDATLSGDTDKENASATKLDDSVSKFWDDYYEMNPKALEKEQRKREVNKALSKQ